MRDGAITGRSVPVACGELAIDRLHLFGVRQLIRSAVP